MDKFDTDLTALTGEVFDSPGRETQNGTE